MRKTDNPCRVISLGSLVVVGRFRNEHLSDRVEHDVADHRDANRLDDSLGSIDEVVHGDVEVGLVGVVERGGSGAVVLDEADLEASLLHSVSFHRDLII